MRWLVGLGAAIALGACSDPVGRTIGETAAMPFPRQLADIPGDPSTLQRWASGDGVGAAPAETIGVERAALVAQAAAGQMALRHLERRLTAAGAAHRPDLARRLAARVVYDRWEDDDGFQRTRALVDLRHLSELGLGDATASARSAGRWLSRDRRAAPSRAPSAPAPPGVRWQANVARPAVATRFRVPTPPTTWLILWLPQPMPARAAWLERLPEGWQATGRIWANGPDGVDRARRPDGDLALASVGATALAYEIREPSEGTAAGRLAPGGDIAHGRGAVPAPAALDLRSPRVLLAVSRTRLMAAVYDRSGVADVRLGPTADRATSIPIRAAARIVQIDHPWTPGAGQVLVVTDRVGNVGALSLAPESRE